MPDDPLAAHRRPRPRRDPLMLGFHTAGLLLHDEPTAIEELSRIGYSAVTLRPRRGHLDPDSRHLGDWIDRVRGAAERCGVRLVLDADGRFMHDPRVDRGPSLAAANRDEAEGAVRWLETIVDVADRLRATAVTFATGAAPSPLTLTSDEQTLERLAAQIRLLAAAAEGRTTLAIRPASGQAVATVAQYERLLQWLDADPVPGLAADIGEMITGGELPIADRLARNTRSLACVYLCDRGGGVPGDRRFGHGDVALGRVTRSLQSMGFAGPVILRVEGHSEWGLESAAEAFGQISRGD